VNGLVAAVGTVNTGMINAREAMHYSVLAQSVNALVTMATGVVGVWLHWPFSVILLFSLGATCLYVAIGAFFAGRLYRNVQDDSLRNGAGWGGSITLALKSIPFGLLVLISVLFTNTGIIFLGWFHVSDALIGQFAAALRIYSLVILVPGALGDALFPGLARIYAESQDRFARVFEFAWRIFFFVTIPMAAGLWLVSRDVLLLMYGPDYIGGVRSLQILSLMLLNGVGYVMGRAMVAVNRQTLSAVIQGVALIIVAGTAWWAIPRHGADGVAVAMVGGTLAGLVVYTTLFFRWLHLRFPSIWCVKTVMAVAVMGAVASAVHTWTGSLAVVLITAPTIYVLAHLALRTLSREDWAQVVGLLPGRLAHWIVVWWAGV